MAYQITLVALDQIKINPHNARVHSKKQIRAISWSIEKFGFTNPIQIDENNILLAGHGRLEAAKLLGMREIPVVVIRGLTPAQRRAVVLADNRLAEAAGWDREKLSTELLELGELLKATLRYSQTCRSNCYEVLAKCYVLAAHDSMCIAALKFSNVLACLFGLGRGPTSGARRGRVRRRIGPPYGDSNH